MHFVLLLIHCHMHHPTLYTGCINVFWLNTKCYVSSVDFHSTEGKSSNFHPFPSKETAVTMKWTSFSLPLSSRVLRPRRCYLFSWGYNCYWKSDWSRTLAHFSFVLLLWPTSMLHTCPIKFTTRTCVSFAKRASHGFPNCSIPSPPLHFSFSSPRAVTVHTCTFHLFKHLSFASLPPPPPQSERMKKPATCSIVLHTKETPTQVEQSIKDE